MTPLKLNAKIEYISVRHFTFYFSKCEMATERHPKDVNNNKKNVQHICAYLHREWSADRKHVFHYEGSESDYYRGIKF